MRKQHFVKKQIKRCVFLDTKNTWRIWANQGREISLLDRIHPTIWFEINKTEFRKHQYEASILSLREPMVPDLSSLWSTLKSRRSSAEQSKLPYWNRNCRQRVETPMRFRKWNVFLRDTDLTDWTSRSCHRLKCNGPI